MVIDTSALVAILEQEPEAQAFSESLASAGSLLVSAATVVETGIVILARRGEAGAAKLDRLLDECQAEIVSVTADHARLARDGFIRFGKGRHPAGLNFGDCFSYALARATERQLLFKGQDFSQTDVEPAIPPEG